MSRPFARFRWSVKSKSSIATICADPTQIERFSLCDRCPPSPRPAPSRVPVDATRLASDASRGCVRRGSWRLALPHSGGSAVGSRSAGSGRLGHRESLRCACGCCLWPRGCLVDRAACAHVAHPPSLVRAPQVTNGCLDDDDGSDGDAYDGGDDYDEDAWLFARHASVAALAALATATRRQWP